MKLDRVQRQLHSRFCILCHRNGSPSNSCARFPHTMASIEPIVENQCTYANQVQFPCQFQRISEASKHPMPQTFARRDTWIVEIDKGFPAASGLPSVRCFQHPRNQGRSSILLVYARKWQRAKAFHLENHIVLLRNRCRGFYSMPRPCPLRNGNLCLHL